MEKGIPLWPIHKKVDAPWIPSPKIAIIHALNLAKIGERERFADVGCGDGRAAIIASKYVGSYSTCIEVRDELCVLSQANAVYNGVADKFEVICADAREVNYRGFDVVYLYMFPSFLEEISKKLDEEMKFGSRVVTLDFAVKGWEPILLRRFNDEAGVKRTIFLYLIGLSNPGAWRLTNFNGYPRI